LDARHRPRYARLLALLGPVAVVALIPFVGLTVGLTVVADLLPEEHVEIRQGARHLARWLLSAVWSTPFLVLAGGVLRSTVSPEKEPGAQQETTAARVATVGMLFALGWFWPEYQPYLGELASRYLPPVLVSIPACGLVVLFAFTYFTLKFLHWPASTRDSTGEREQRLRDPSANQTRAADHRLPAEPLPDHRRPIPTHLTESARPTLQIEADGHVVWTVKPEARVSLLVRLVTALVQAFYSIFGLIWVVVGLNSVVTAFTNPQERDFLERLGDFGLGVWLTAWGALLLIWMIGIGIGDGPHLAWREEVWLTPVRLAWRRRLLWFTRFWSLDIPRMRAIQTAPGRFLPFRGGSSGYGAVVVDHETGEFRLGLDLDGRPAAMLAAAIRSRRGLSAEPIRFVLAGYCAVCDAKVPESDHRCKACGLDYCARCVLAAKQCLGCAGPVAPIPTD